MSAYYERWCPEHGDYSADVDGDQECEQCFAEGKTERQLLLVRAEKAEAALAAAEQLAERLKMEAQIHAGEARTANATIAEIYQVCTDSTGEPGNWHGAEPVRELKERAEELERKLAERAADAERFEWCLDEPEGAQHLLYLLKNKKGDKESFRKMLDRIRESKALALAVTKGGEA